MSHDDPETMLRTAIDENCNDCDVVSAVVEFVVNRRLAHASCGLLS